MRMIQLESGNLHSLGYDPDAMELEVYFKPNMSHYKYQAVPAEEVCAVLFAESQGGEFNKRIVKGGYPYEKLGA